MAKNLSSDRELFDSFFPGLVNDIVKESENDKDIGDAVRHMREVFSLTHSFSTFILGSV